MLPEPYSRGRPTNAHGFTLIELMIVVAIVAILSTIALPAYNDYITRSKIAEATSTLANQRVRMEQYYQDNRTYVNACAAGSAAAPPTVRYFTYTCTPAPTATTYTIVATGVPGQGMSGFTYTIDQANSRQTTAVPSAAWGTTPATCWITKKGGVC